MFQGIISALITPFDSEGQVDRDALKRLVDYQIGRGIHGIVPCGTTGESATLTHGEHQSVIAACIEAVAGRIPVIAGTGSNATDESIRLTRFAKEAGADGALLITPYYNKPTQEGLYQHYRAVAEAVDLPILLYNVPGRTAVDMQPATVARLAALPNVVGIKEATASMERASELRAVCGPDFTLLSGDDATLLPFLAVGGRGVISVTANLVPDRQVRLWNAFHAGDLTTALAEHDALLPLSQALFCESNPIPVKAAAAMLGLCEEALRLPLTPITPANRQRVREALLALGLDANKGYSTGASS